MESRSFPVLTGWDLAPRCEGARFILVTHMGFERYWSAWLLFHFSWSRGWWKPYSNQPCLPWKVRPLNFSVEVVWLASNGGKVLPSVRQKQQLSVDFPLHQWLRCTIPQSDFWEVLLKPCLLGALQLIHSAETWNYFSCVRANRWPFPRRRYWAFCTGFAVWWKSRLTGTAKSEGWIISDSWLISYWCRRSCYAFVVMLQSSISSPLGKDIKG